MFSRISSFHFNPINSGDDTKIQIVCLNWAPEFAKQFNAQTGSKVVPLRDWTEVERLSAPLYILYICIEHSQQASAKISQKGSFSYMQSLRQGGLEQDVQDHRMPQDAFEMSPSPLSRFMTVQMHLQRLMNRLKIHTDTQTATPQREIVLSYPQML